VTHLNFWGTSNISEKTEARVVKSCTLVGYIKSWPTNDQPPLTGTWLVADS